MSTLNVKMLKWVVTGLLALFLPLSQVNAEKVYKLTEPEIASKDGSAPKPPKASEPVDPNRFKKFLVVDLSAQRIDMYENGDKVFSTPCATGKEEKATRNGVFHVTNKHEKWVSTIYGVSMPHFLRLNNSDFGLHAGYLPGYPASHGCIRMPEDAATHLFEVIPIGTPVIIQGEAPDKEWIKQQYRVKYSPTSRSISKGPRATNDKPNFNPPFPIIPLGSSKDDNSYQPKIVRAEPPKPKVKADAAKPKADAPKPKVKADAPKPKVKADAPKPKVKTEAKPKAEAEPKKKKKSQE